MCFVSLQNIIESILTINPGIKESRNNSTDFLPLMRLDENLLTIAILFTMAWNDNNSVSYNKKRRSKKWSLLHFKKA